MIARTALAAATARGLPATAEPVLGDDGLYKPDWFLQSFLELGHDFEEAAAENSAPW